MKAQRTLYPSWKLHHALLSSGLNYCRLLVLSGFPVLNLAPPTSIQNCVNQNCLPLPTPQITILTAWLLFQIWYILLKPFMALGSTNLSSLIPYEIYPCSRSWLFQLHHPQLSKHLRSYLTRHPWCATSPILFKPLHKTHFFTRLLTQLFSSETIPKSCLWN